MDDRPLVADVEPLAEIRPDDLARRFGELVGEGNRFAVNCHCWQSSNASVHFIAQRSRFLAPLTGRKHISEPPYCTAGNKGQHMKSVVVTGASTGIGWAMSKVLIAKGFRTFGSVRKAAVGGEPEDALHRDAAAVPEPDEARPAKAHGRRHDRGTAWVEEELFDFHARATPAVVRRERLLAQADRLRRHFDQLVVLDIGDRLFERHRHDRRQAHRLVLGGGADVGELLGLAAD